MDAKEALKELSYPSFEYGGKCTLEVRKEAIKALEKQIPEKPGNVFQLTDFCANRYAFKGNCPKCNKIGLYSWTKYCPECGQALDWEEHQEE